MNRGLFFFALLVASSGCIAPGPGGNPVVWDAGEPLADEVPSLALLPVVALGYQDPEDSEDCVLEQEHTGLVSSLDGAWAPGEQPEPCRDYYASGTSVKNFDALALRFDLSGLEPGEYKAVLAVYLKQGGYRDLAWHHYALYPDFKDNSRCFDDKPDCDGIPFSPEPFEGWVLIPVEGSYWNDGEFSLRLWNAMVDSVELRLFEE